MFRLNSKVGLLVPLLVAIGFLSPMTAWAHRFGGANDPCERKVGASFVHITLYQPQFDPDAEYCDSVPRDGNTVVVVDVLGEDLRRLPIGLQLVAMGGSGAPRTILNVAPRVYRRGVADAQVVLGEGLQYVVRVAIQDGDPPRLFSFPIRVAAWYRMLIVPSMIFLALVSLIAISIARYYWWGPSEKSPARLIDFDPGGPRSDARAPRAVRARR
jgi:hypothetical protein